MKLLEFWEEISLMPDAVRQLEKLEITEGEYEKLRELFLRDVNLFYEAVKKREDFRLVFLYCFSKMACEVYDRYCEQGISRRVYRDTFYDLTLWCENCYKAYGEYGIAQYDWFCRHLDMSLFRLGRLEFEKIPSLWEIQTDGISVHKGDPVISVHIPQGEKLELDACLDSFRQAEQFWKEKQVYLCHSWLLYPGLKEIMKPESNILQFQTLFHIVAVDFEWREAEERIFGELETDPRSYAEDTSLQRAARKYLLSGEKLGSGLGVWTGEEKTQIQQIIFTHGYRNTQKNWLTQQIIFFGIRNFPKKKSYLQPVFLTIWKKKDFVSQKESQGFRPHLLQSGEQENRYLDFWQSMTLFRVLARSRSARISR